LVVEHLAGVTTPLSVRTRIAGIAAVRRGSEARPGFVAGGQAQRVGIGTEGRPGRAWKRARR
jgi:hypothetical protein